MFSPGGTLISASAAPHCGADSRVWLQPSNDYSLPHLIAFNLIDLIRLIWFDCSWYLWSSLNVRRYRLWRFCFQSTGLSICSLGLSPCAKHGSHSSGFSLEIDNSCSDDRHPWSLYRVFVEELKAPPLSPQTFDLTTVWCCVDFPALKWMWVLRWLWLIFLAISEADRHFECCCWRRVMLCSALT